ncbi:MAG: hypothetical protein V1868_02235 [Patescibacteria group bacterium]
MAQVSYSQKEKLRFALIFIVFFVLVLTNFTSFGKKIPPVLGLTLVIILAAVAFLFVLPKRTLFPKMKIKETINGVAEKLNLEIQKTEGKEKLLAPIWASDMAEGDYKNFHVKVRPGGSSLFFVSLFGSLHAEVNITIEISRVLIPLEAPIIKNDFKARYIELPLVLKNLPYNFLLNRIIVEDDKLILITEDKIPTPNDAVLIVEELVKIAQNFRN